MIRKKEENVLIEVKNLVKRYGQHIAVDNLSFTAEKGQILGFLGPNGAGKSTTMNIITGYISATEGTVNINGHDIFEEPEEAKKSIGYLPEMPPLYPDMKVKEYLKFVTSIKGVKKENQISMLNDIMKLTKVVEVENRLIKHLSKGYKQRVGLAGAMIGYPELIILDEPTVGLDPMQIIEIRDLIKDLSKNHTIILSSHILSEVSAVCDTVMIINKGKMIVSDTPKNLTKHMKNANMLNLKIKGTKDKIEEVLNEVEGITNIEFEDSQEDGISQLTISSGKEDIREKIFYVLAHGSCPIFEMQSLHASLEDVFIEVTKEEKEEE
jgi:ABC-2 type transport system ATP-binding protein